MMDVASIGLAGQVAWFRFLAGSERAGSEHAGSEHAGSDLVRSWTVGTGFAAVTGLQSNSDNGIVLDRRALCDHGVVRSLVELMRAEGTPASLILSEPATSDEIKVLLELGLTPENSANEMHLSVERWPLAVAASPVGGVNIVEVIDDAMLQDGLRVLGAGWFDDRELERYATLFESLGLGPGHRLRHWVVYRGDRPVAMATSFLFDQAVTLMHCGVLASERRQGIGAALTNTRLRAANHDGAVVAVLAPSPDGYLLHRSLGFELKPCPPDRWFYL